MIYCVSAAGCLHWNEGWSLETKLASLDWEKLEHFRWKTKVTSYRLYTIIHFFCEVFHAMQLDKGLPFEKLRMALISKWLHIVGSLSPLMRRRHLPKPIFEDSLTDRQLISTMNFLIEKYHFVCFPLIYLTQKQHLYLSDVSFLLFIPQMKS